MMMMYMMYMMMEQKDWIVSLSDVELLTDDNELFDDDDDKLLRNSCMYTYNMKQLT